MLSLGRTVMAVAVRLAESEVNLLCVILEVLGPKHMLSPMMTCLLMVAAHAITSLDITRIYDLLAVRCMNFI